MKMFRRFFVFVGWCFAALTILTVLTVMVLLIKVVSGQGEEGDGVNLGGLKIKTEHAVGVLELTGDIMFSDKFERSLKKFLDNEKLKAVVVRIDSPGGTVGASEEIFRSIKAGTAKKPIVCALGDMAASGGLYAAVGCSKIVANAGTLTGSIGVIMMTPSVMSLLDKVGVRMNVIKSGKFKDAGSPFREMSQEDRDLLQRLINTSYEQFLTTVAESRNLPLDKVRQFADGRIILGAEAKELGLVDEIGGVNRAAKMALELTNDQAEPEIVKPGKPTGIMAIIADSAESSIFRWLNLSSKSRVLYHSLL